MNMGFDRKRHKFTVFETNGRNSAAPNIVHNLQ